ncbi:arylsulfatase G-like [Amphiura filiformis]|uniref:arylsulfatase G-like n=1 Tax=Amphiura filiformis TaxID=82378 RepID=UPI003B21B725
MTNTRGSCTCRTLILFAALSAIFNSAISCQPFISSIFGCDSSKVTNDVRPNFIIILADDMGWGDLGANWNPDGMVSDTPYMDKIAADGIRFTDFHSGASVCSPSRAALLTGRLGKRTGVIHNFGKGAEGGLPLNETTFAETFRAAGYKTGMVGKWHLGTKGLYHPYNRGFDFYFGLPYSNDMGCMDDPGGNLPACPACPKDNSTLLDEAVFKAPSGCDMKLAVPLYNNTSVIEQPVNQTTLTARYTDRATAFIKQSAAEKQPFVLYVAFAHMHVPLIYNRTKFGNKSLSRGMYGDVLREMDYAVADIVSAVQDVSVDKNTLIWFSSDNGPWELKCNFGGSIGPYVGGWQKEQGGGGSSGKQTVWEGGHRVPSFAYWPGRIKPGQVDDSILSALDIYPTMASIANVNMPTYRKYDGVDVSEVLFSGKKIRNRSLFHPNSGAFGSYGNFDGVRINGTYKAIFESGGSPECGGNTGTSASHNPPLIFDIFNDIRELSPLDNTSATYAKVMSTLKTVLSDIDLDINKDNTTVVDYNTSSDDWPCCDSKHVVCRCQN